MTNRPSQAAIPALSGTHTRRDVLRGALVAGTGALALSAFGGHLTVPAAAASAAPGAGVSAGIADEMVPREKFTIQSTIAANLTRSFATAPLFEGTFNGQPVWYIITDVSDEGMASKLGVNFAPRLANIPVDSPTVQRVMSGNPLLGRDMVTFAGVPDFRPTRLLLAGPKGFPPARFAPGSHGDARYNDLVRIGDSAVVFNAPVIATGTGPFDVTTHSNTHDRVLRIDTGGMNVDLQFVRAFSHGQLIIYHSMAASDPLGAALDQRGTFNPKMGKIPVSDTRTADRGARSSIFAFVNGQTGLDNPAAQGLNHMIVVGAAAGDASAENTVLQDILRRGGDPRNIIDTFPTLRDPVLARRYTPIWDIQLARWTDEAVAQGRNVAQRDTNQIRQLAARGLVTAPDHLPLVNSNIAVNCPVIAFVDQPPTEPQAPDPGRTPNAP